MERDGVGWGRGEKITLSSKFWDIYNESTPRFINEAAFDFGFRQDLGMCIFALTTTTRI